MAEPGDPAFSDPPKPTDPVVDHDDLIGFSSVAALQGRPRVVAEPEPEPVPPVGANQPARPEPEPDLFASIDRHSPHDAAPSVSTPEPEPAPSMETFSAPQPEPTPVSRPAPLFQATPVSQPEPTPSWAVESPRAAGSIRMDGRTVMPPNDVANSTGLYAVYALILFAVPTLGVSALIALLAVTGRPGPTGTVAASHFVFQQRTLWSAAVAALLGAILIAVGLGVFVLFVVAVWLILRGASGILALKAGRPARNPRGWFLA